MPTPSPRAKRRSPGETTALFVRIPVEQARLLDRAAFEQRRPKQALVSELLERHIGSEGARRRVTVETLEPDTMVVGHHSFRAHEPGAAAAPGREVLRSEEAAALLQVELEVVEQLAQAGELPGRRLGGEWRFSREALLAWLARGEDEGDR